MARLLAAPIPTDDERGALTRLARRGNVRRQAVGRDRFLRRHLDGVPNAPRRGVPLTVSGERVGTAAVRTLGS